LNCPPPARKRPKRGILRYELNSIQHSQDDWCGDLRAEGLLEQLRAGRYRRTAIRRGYRNGHYHRGLLLEWGLVANPIVPRDREGQFHPRVLERYQRKQKRLGRLIREMFLQGGSTRRVGEVLEPILQEKVSAQSVSRIVKSLDAEGWRFHRRYLGDDYSYLLLDGIYLKAKQASGVKRGLVLCAYGITRQGQRQMLAFRQATAESEAQWEAFVRDLYERGLEGENLKLIVTDGNTGLHNALETVYPYTDRQRCWVHKLRNVEAKLPKRAHHECLAGLKLVYQAGSRRQAISRSKSGHKPGTGSIPKR
jgi:putative transposase